MELTAEQKKQLEEQKANCPFCQIIAGKIPSQKVYEDDLVIGILDINPAKEGHVLFMTKNHYPIAPLIPPLEFENLISKLKLVSEKIKEAILLTDSVNIFVANGGAAGQQAPHFMIHIIPRQKNDGLKNFKLAQKDIAKEKISELFKVLKHNIPLILKEKAEKYKITSLDSSVSIEQVIEIINQNPKLKNLLLNDLEKGKEVISQNEKLKFIFSKVSLDEVLNRIKENINDVSVENKVPEKNDEVNLDDISKLF